MLTPNGNMPFGLYKERTLELLAHTFAPAHTRVFNHYWNNENYSRVKAPYYSIDFESGDFEFYIPTFEAQEENMKFYRIQGTVLPEVDRKIQREQSRRFKQKRTVNPPGSIDSESLVIIAQKCTKESGRDRKLWARGYKTWAGYMELIIVSKLPESTAKRFIMLIHNFIKKRLVALLKSLNLYELAGLYNLKQAVYYQTLRIIVSDVSASLENAFSCLNHFLNFLQFRVGQILREIGVQNQFMAVFYKCEELKKLLFNFSKIPSYLKSVINHKDLIKISNLLEASIRGGGG